MKRAKRSRLTQADRDALRAAAKVADRGERCAHHVLDNEKRASICGKPAVAERDISTGDGDEKVCLTFCAEHVAAVDANGGEIKIEPKGGAR